MPLPERLARNNGETAPSRQTFIDALIAGGIWVLGSALIIYFDLFESLHDASRSVEDWELDEAFPIIFVLVLAVAWFAYRRLREARSALADLRNARREEERLRHELRHAHKMEALGNLAGGISHEFGNLLLPIVSMTELTLRNLPADSPIRPNLEVVLEAGRQSRTLIQQVLLYTEQAESETRILDLRDAVRDGLRFAAMVLPWTIDFEQNLGEEPIEIRADPAEIQRIIVDLVVRIAEDFGARSISFDRVAAEGVSNGAGYTRPNVQIILRHDGSDVEKASEDTRSIRADGQSSTSQAAAFDIARISDALAELGGSIRAEAQTAGPSSLLVTLPVLEQETMNGTHFGG